VQILALALLGGLAAMFVASAFAKVTYWDETLAWLAELFPRLRPDPVARGVVAAEVLIAVATVTAPRAGAAAAALWLVMASAVLWHGRSRVADCGCFGLRQRLAIGVVFRNATFILVAVVATALAGPGLVVMIELLPLAAVVGATAVVLREAVERRGVVV
jgi:hypothetical protein